MFLIGRRRGRRSTGPQPVEADGRRPPLRSPQPARARRDRLDLFAVLLGGATALLPVYARDILHAGPQGLGHLRAAPAVGATLTAVFFSVRPLKHNVGVKMLAAVGVFGAATIVFGLSRWMPLSLACLALLGAADMFSVYVRQSLIQLYTPDDDARPRRRGVVAVHFGLQRARRSGIAASSAR